MSGSLTAAEHDADGNFALLHHPLTIGFLVAWVATAGAGDQDIIQIQIDLAYVEIRYARIAYRGKYATEIRIAGEERRLHQR